MPAAGLPTTDAREIRRTACWLRRDMHDGWRCGERCPVQIAAAIQVVAVEQPEVQGRELPTGARLEAICLVLGRGHGEPRCRATGQRVEVVDRPRLDWEEDRQLIGCVDPTNLRDRRAVERPDAGRIPVAAAAEADAAQRPVGHGDIRHCQRQHRLDWLDLYTIRADQPAGSDIRTAGQILDAVLLSETVGTRSEIGNVQPELCAWVCRHSLGVGTTDPPAGGGIRTPGKLNLSMGSP